MDPIRLDTRYTISAVGPLDTRIAIVPIGPLNTRLSIAPFVVDTGYGVQDAALVLLETGDALLEESGGRILMEVGTSKKISALPAAATLVGGEIVPLVQAGSTVTVTTTQIAAWIAGEL